DTSTGRGAAPARRQARRSGAGSGTRPIQLLHLGAETLPSPRSKSGPDRVGPAILATGRPGARNDAGLRRPTSPGPFFHIPQGIHGGLTIIRYRTNYLLPKCQ